MDFDTLLVSDYQLLALSNNKKLDRDIRALAARELERRKLPPELLLEVRERYQAFAEATAPRRLTRQQIAFAVFGSSCSS